MALRTKFFLTSLLLVLVVCCTIYTAKVTTASWQNFQQKAALAKANDVRAISDWMSIAYIAHTYHVPENYLAQSLNLPAAATIPHATHLSLNTLALHTKRPVNDLIHNMQIAITNYRKQHSSYYPTPSPNGKKPTPTAGRSTH